MTPCRSCHPAASNQPTISQLARQLRLYSCKQQPPSTLLAMPQRLQTPMPRQAGCCSSPAYATQLLTEAAGASHMPPVNASVPMQAVLACHTITLRQQVGNLFFMLCSLLSPSPIPNDHILFCIAERIACLLGVRGYIIMHLAWGVFLFQHSFTKIFIMSIQM